MQLATHRPTRRHTWQPASAPRDGWRRVYADPNGRAGARGTSPGAALPTISAALSAAPAVKPWLRLRRGATWREELVSAIAGQVIDAWGTGARPKIDATDVVTGWTDVGDGSYSKALSIAADGSSQYVRAFEDGVVLTRAASQAACASTAGTYYPSGESGNITLYVHPTSGAPGSNGKVYEVTARAFAVKLTGASARVAGIHGRGVLDKDGCINIQGASSVIEDCRAQDGTQHSMFGGRGVAIRRNCLIDDCYAANFGGMLVVFEDAGSGKPFSISDVTITNKYAQPAGDVRSAIEGHTNSGSMGGATIRGVTIDGSAAPGGYGIAGGVALANTGSVNIEGLTVLGALTGITTYSDTVVDATSQIKAARTGVASGANDHSVTFCGKVCIEDPNYFRPALHFTHTGVDVTVDGAMLSDDGGGDFLGIGIQHAGSGSLSISNATFGAGGFAVQAWIVTAAILGTMTSDNNHFEGNVGHQFKDSTTPATYTLADVPNGLEANSDTAGDASAACA